MFNIKTFTLVVIIFSMFGCNSKSTNCEVTPAENIRQLTVLYTNDEHGWLEGENTEGAAGLMGLWKENEGYSQDGPFLILSGGDSWTGPAISTWFSGESMQDVMNAMHYNAAAIGNHEFDFKIEGLYDRLVQSNFPFLAANIREKATGAIPDFAQPYLVIEKNGIQVGIIGLASIATPSTTLPDNVQDFDFIDYDTAITEIMPEVLEDGAELLIIIGHICDQERQELVPLAQELNIVLIGGGHCHQLHSDMMSGVGMIESRSNMSYYAKAEISFDTINDVLIDIDVSTHPNINAEIDPEVEAVVTYWRSQMDDQLSQVVGYAGQEIGMNSNEMHNMVTDSWLVTFPNAHISFTNTGGIRQAIPNGDVTLETMVGVLPFENTIIEMELTGTQLIDSISEHVVGGMTTIGGFILNDGSSIHNDSTYVVLTNSYLYSVMEALHQYDPDPYDTSVHYRQPVIDWIESLNTTTANPLENFLDFESRQ